MMDFFNVLGSSRDSEDKRELARRRIGRQVRRYVDDVGAEEMEAILQEYAQTCREAQEPHVTGDDLEGWCR